MFLQETSIRFVIKLFPFRINFPPRRKKKKKNPFVEVWGANQSNEDLIKDVIAKCHGKFILIS